MIAKPWRIGVEQELHHLRVDHVGGEFAVVALDLERLVELLALEFDVVEADCARDRAEQPFAAHVQVRQRPLQSRRIDREVVRLRRRRLAVAGAGLVAVGEAQRGTARAGRGEHVERSVAEALTERRTPRQLAVAVVRGRVAVAVLRGPGGEGGLAALVRVVATDAGRDDDKDDDHDHDSDHQREPPPRSTLTAWRAPGSSSSK